MARVAKTLREEFQADSLNTQTTHFIDMDRCPRCGQAHGALQFRPLLGDSIRVKTEEYGNGTNVVSHYGTCPTTSAVILAVVEAWVL